MYFVLLNNIIVTLCFYGNPITVSVCCVVLSKRNHKILIDVEEHRVEVCHKSVSFLINSF